MALLVLIAAGVLRQQARFNPAVTALEDLRQAALVSEPGPSPDQTLVPLDGGLAPLSAVERFTADTLYEKINGRAELYLAAGFRSLASQRLFVNGDRGAWFELFIYDMGSADSAFAVFSVQRREDAAPLDVAPAAYATANALFMAHGQYYLEMIGAAATEALTRGMREAARAFVTATPVQVRRLAPADLFPSRDLEPGSVTLIASDAFGFDRLDRVATAVYTIDGAELTAFVSARATPDEARELAAALGDYFEQFGGVALADIVLDQPARVLDVLDTTEVIVHRGVYLFGVHEAWERPAALVLANRLIAHLQGIAGAP